tara:strand:- start:306 stop:506 length:201 start_codon:yes stop_codon:yes gene_type:complete
MLCWPLASLLNCRFERASDASSVFSLLFGWAFTLPILGGWLIVYAIASGVRVMMKKRVLAASTSSS